MSIDIKYCDTFINALSKSYTSGDYVRTFGFASVGDGGAALYKVTEAYKVDEIDISSICYEDGKFYYVFDNVLKSSTFKLIPQHGVVYAEQFGVMPENENYYKSNTSMLNRAISYASDHGVRLEFATKGTYYLNSNICLKSNLFIDGNGAVLVQHTDAPNGTGMFCTEKIDNVYVARKNITINNITLIGRTNENQNLADQAFHVCIEGFTLRNVNIKNFNYAVHTFGRSAAEYTVPEIPNKNWLFENCSISDTIMGINCSELDGFVIKNSSVGGRLDATKNNHCVYLSSNCSNVRITGSSLHNVSGDAIHKAYPVSETDRIADISKNHFYTDLSINDADSALNIGIISQNVMCDNVFATKVEIALQISGADNCIVSNSNFSQTRSHEKMQAFIYAQNACNCWLQNSYVYYNGRHRVTSEYLPSEYVKKMFDDKQHRRMYIGQDFKTPNHWLKFTGCEFVSKKKSSDKYFYERYHSVTNSNIDVSLRKEPSPSQYGEYWDNCSLVVATEQDVFYLNCINDFPGGITIRNTYMKNVELEERYQPPFRIGCDQENRDSNYCKNVCPVYPDSCILSAFGKRYPWIRFENNFYAYKFSIYWDKTSWRQYIKSSSDISVEQFLKLTGSYSSKCYTVDDNGNYLSMIDLM